MFYFKTSYMITETRRKELEKEYPLLQFSKTHIGFDCDGKFIDIGDQVEVVVEEETRTGNKKYKYCSTGKTGKAQRHYNGWTVIVKFSRFGTNQTVGCTDYYLRKI